MFGLAVAGAGSPARADRDIVFSAQWYQWDGYYHDRGGGPPERKLADRGAYHLYRINPDGSHPTRITSGSRGEFMPRWSPDGRRILFLRALKRGFRLCLAGPSGGPARRLVSVTDDFRYYGKYAWSPDGRRVAVYQPDFRHDRPFVVVLDLRTGERHVHPYGRSFAWSPDSKRLFLTFASLGRQVARCEIWDFSGRKPKCVRRISTGVSDPVWLDDGTIIGEKPAAGDKMYSGILHVISPDGRKWKTIPLKAGSTVRNGKRGADGLFDQKREWRRLPERKDQLAVESSETISDGGHYKCHRVDMRTGKYWPIRQGQLIGISPDGRLCAVADRNWVGPYKRGGRRCGPLEIVSLKNGKARAITSRLVSIEGGDWRRERR